MKWLQVKIQTRASDLATGWQCAL